MKDKFIEIVYKRLCKLEPEGSVYSTHDEWKKLEFTFYNKITKEIVPLKSIVKVDIVNFEKTEKIKQTDIDESYNLNNNEREDLEFWVKYLAYYMAEGEGYLSGRITKEDYEKILNYWNEGN